MSKALVEAGRLKPEIRLSQALSEFGASLDEKRRIVFKNLQSRSPPAAGDVIRLTEEINRDGSRAHKAWRPYATRLVGLLEKIQVISQVGDILVGGSQCMIASGVWATVRLSLLMATASLSFFEKLSTLFMKLGRSSAVTSDLALLFPKCRQLQDLLCEYLILVVAFCQKLVKYSQKSLISQLAMSPVVLTEKDFNTFQKELDQLSSLIDRRVTYLTSQSQIESTSALVKAGRSLAGLVPSETKKREALLKQRAHILDHLCHFQHDFEFYWRRQRKKGNPKWIFDNDAYQAWKASSASASLWITGKLGSGKTVLMAAIVGNLFSPPPLTSQGLDKVRHDDLVVYFFCHHNDPRSLEGRYIFGSIARQLFSILDVDGHLMKALKGRLELGTTLSTDEILPLLLEFLPKDRQVFVIIDALDECPDSELPNIITALGQLMQFGRIQLCCSSRGSESLVNLAKTMLSLDYQIFMNDLATESEMAEYVEAELEIRRHIRKLDSALENLIKKVLIAAAEGMYLWLTLQLDTIFPLYHNKLLSEADIIHMLENLPKDLPEAFDRALGRISDKRYGKTIFQLVAVARRPLTLQELRVCLNVTPGKAEWEPVSLASDARSVVSLCGGTLLEVDEENDCIHFIHGSVLQHLLSTPAYPHNQEYYFSEQEADLYMAMICVTYLNYGVFDTQLLVSRSLVINSENFGKGIAGSAYIPDNLTTKFVTAIKKRRNHEGPNVDIGRILHQHMSSKLETGDVFHFLGYAMEYFMTHTAQLSNEIYPNALELWMKVIETEKYPSPKLPWSDINTSAGMEWAAEHCHAPAFYYFLGSRFYIYYDRSRLVTMDYIVKFAERNQCKFKMSEGVRAGRLEPALHHTVEWKHINSRLLQQVEGFVRLGVDVNSKDYDGHTYFEKAVGAINYHVAKLLLDSGANVDSELEIRGEPIIVNALRLQWWDIVERLLPPGVPIPRVELPDNADLNPSDEWRPAILEQFYPRVDGDMTRFEIAVQKMHRCPAIYFLKTDDQIFAAGRSAASVAMDVARLGWTEVLAILVERGYCRAEDLVAEMPG